MKLLALNFTRAWSSKDTEPLVGKAEFEDERGSRVNMVLDQDQAARIMEICQESLARELKSAAEAMTQSLKSAIELKKKTDIGNTLPSSW